MSLFLQETRQILSKPNSLNLQLTRKGENLLDAFTTRNTLLSLGYNTEDVRNEIMSLQPRDYIETVPDLARQNSPPFWIFEKKIKGRSVYIKFKMRNNNLIFCMSFHYAKRLITKADKPYA